MQQELNNPAVTIPLILRLPGRSMQERNDLLRKPLSAMPNLNTVRDKDGNPPVYLAAWENNAEAIRMFYEVGASVEVRNVQGLLPLHAACLHVDGDHSETVRLILALSTSSDGVQVALAKDEFLQRLTEYRKKFLDEVGKGKESHLDILQKLGPIPVNETVHYWFCYVRHRPYTAIALERLPAGIIKTDVLGPVGQRLAKHVFRGVMSAWEVDKEKKTRARPRVIAFCGPSGHGKTELATQYAKDAGLPKEQTLVVDCGTELDSRFAAIGSSVGFEAGTTGSRLNNFFIKNSGKPAVLVLDEFEKCPTEVQDSFLSIFDGSPYRDRTDKSGSKEADLSNFVFIITTNVADPAIKRYCQQPRCKAELLEDSRCFDQTPGFLNRHRVALKKEIQHALNAHFKYPLSGRITDHVPFLPFTKTEAAVVADTFVRPWLWRLRSEATPLRKLGWVESHLYGDLNSFLSLEYMEGGMDIGARGIENCVSNYFQQQVYERYVFGEINSDRDNSPGEQEATVDS